MSSPALNRELDTQAMVEVAMAAILHDKVFSKMLLIDPFASFLWADAAVTFAFPDPVLLELGKVGDADRAEVLRAQQLRVLGALDAATNYLKTGYHVRQVHDDLRHDFTIKRAMGEPEAEGEVLVETVTTSVSLVDFRSIDVLREMLDILLQADAVQLARDISLVVRVRGSIGKFKIEGELFDGKAERRPVGTWLAMEHKADVVAWFRIPEVAAMVAEGCRDHRVTVDKMNKGAAVTKRANLAENRPITILSPKDVGDLAELYDFGAFYPWVERHDGLVGRLVADLDMGKGFVSLLGPRRAWAACCNVSDAIVAGATALGMPVPARLFSGSRGIHVVWDVDPEAFQLNDDKRIDCEGYTRAVLAVEPKAEHLSSLDHYLHHPLFASKLFLQAVVLHAMHACMANGAVLDEPGRRALDVARDALACTLDRKKDVRYPTKVCVDCQPLVHRWLSPHHKSGRVTRSIVDEAGAIRAEFRGLGFIQDESELHRVAADLPKRPSWYAPRPGFVPAATVEALCEPARLGVTIAMLLGEGLLACCTMSPGRYVELREYYSRRLDGEGTPP